jgi:hypothetical protein
MKYTKGNYEFWDWCQNLSAVLDPFKVKIHSTQKIV